MKVNNENDIEVNKELKLNIDEQQYDLIHLKEQCDIYNNNLFPCNDYFTSHQLVPYSYI